MSRDTTNPRAKYERLRAAHLTAVRAALGSTSRASSGRVSGNIGSSGQSHLQPAIGATKLLQRGA